MRNKLLLSGASLCAFWVLGLLAAAAWAEPATRPSADGGILPDVTAPAVVKVTLPLIGDKLGCTPEELNAKIYTIKSAADVLPKGMDGPLTQWCAPNAFEADGVGYDMTDGRITRIVLLWAKPGGAAEKKFTDELAKITSIPPNQKGKPVLVEVKNEVSNQSIRLLVAMKPANISVEVEPAQWYVLVHKPSEKIAAAMFARRLIDGMPYDAAVAVFGEPEKSETYNPAGTRAWWNDPGDGKTNMRELTAVVKDGLLTQCSEEKRTPAPGGG